MCTTVTHLTLCSTRGMGDKCISDGCSQCSCLSPPVADRALLSDFCLAFFFTVCISHFFLVRKTTKQNPINYNTELGFFWSAPRLGSGCQSMQWERTETAEITNAVGRTTWEEKGSCSKQILAKNLLNGKK